MTVLQAVRVAVAILVQFRPFFAIFSHWEYIPL
jgi:hypothetical protein